MLTIQDDKVLDDSIVKASHRIRDVVGLPDGRLLLLTDGDTPSFCASHPLVGREFNHDRADKKEVLSSDEGGRPKSTLGGAVAGGL